MRIGFDVSQTGNAKAGCGYYADSLIRTLAATDRENDYILYPAVGDVFWDPECSHATFSCTRPNFQRHPAPRSLEASKAFWTQPGADFEQRLGSPDIFHANNFYCPSGLRSARLVYTLYDISFMAHPEWTTEANRSGCFAGVFGASLRADYMVAISEYSRRHFLETFPHYDAERTGVVYPASRFDEASPCIRPDALSSLQPGRFWLSVATLEPRKNHRRLLQAYAQLKTRHLGTWPLVLAGGRGWMMEEFEKDLGALRLGSDVILAGYLDDPALAWLYRHCFAFLYPSLFEGFGMPVLEAMSSGAPVIAADCTSIPEIAGPAALLVDPLAPASMAAAMDKLVSSRVNPDVLRDAGRQRAKMFSWTASARKLLDIYAAVRECRPDSCMAAAL